MAVYGAASSASRPTSSGSASAYRARSRTDNATGQAPLLKKGVSIQSKCWTCPVAVQDICAVTRSTVSVSARNSCGASAFAPSQILVVP